MSLQPVVVNNKELGFATYHSSLKKEYAAGVSAFDVYDIAQFAINKILCVGEYGNEGTEIVKTHASTAPTGNTVTLAAVTKKTHGKDTPVFIYSFDQVEFSHADTLAGAKTVLGSIQDIDPAQDTMMYEDSVNTAGWYFTRYKNSITGVFSDYSDGVPYSGLPNNTVGYAIDTAMNELDARFSDLLTFDKLMRVSRQMLRLVRGKLKAWSKYQEYNYSIGKISQGDTIFALPATIYDKNSNRSVLNVRVGNGQPLLPLDREDYLKEIGDAVYTEIATEPLVGDTSLVLSDTSDLDDSGAIDIYVSGTKYTINYTTNTRSTNTLSGIAASGDGSITYAYPITSSVWQNNEENEPRFYNISDGSLYIWPLITSDFEGRNILMDYYTDIEEIDSQMDIILGTKFDMLIPYLKFKIRAFTENNGKEDLRDPSYAEFRELLQDAIKNDGGAEKEGFYPRGYAARSNVRDNNSNH